MRACPVCQKSQRTLVKSQYDREDLFLYACSSCNMYYVDSEMLNEMVLNEYYRSVYTTADLPYSDDRLNSLALAVKSYHPENALDIGGMDGELARRLSALGIVAHMEGVDPFTSDLFDAVILSHTLEHVYNTPGMMQRIHDRLKPGGRLFIEIPVWKDYSDLNYDPHWQHINKFTSEHLFNLLTLSGFKYVVRETLPDYLEYHCLRAIALW